LRFEILAKAALRWNVLLPIIALAAGVAAATGAGHYVAARADSAERDLRQRYQARAVVVASQDVRRGQQLDRNALAVRDMPGEFVPADALSPARAGEILGERAAIDIRRGTPVVQAALLPPRTDFPLATQLTQGRRALTIQVDEVNSLSGQLRPGDMVDLLYSRPDSSASELVPLLERLQVLSTGSSSLQDLNPGESGERDFNTVTLLVTSDEAARIVLAEQAGRITVLLRSASDVLPVDIAARDSRDLLRAAGAASSRATAARRIELLTGGYGAEPARSWLTVGMPLPDASGASK
jgi:pilus assembly protein CpaB